jgi:hypothetical protein
VKTWFAYLKEHYPKAMEEFDAAPWNYVFFGPCSMDDEAIIHCTVQIGKEKLEKTYHLEIRL